MKLYQLAYGQTTLDFLLPPQQISAVLDVRPLAPLDDVQAALAHSLEEPMDSPPLREIVRPGERVVVVVNDITRLVGSEVFLPVLCDELHQAGVRDQDITILLATGAHRQHTPDEQRMLVGSAVADRVGLLVDHDPHNDTQMVDYGQTSRGTPVRINRRIADADRVILTGGVAYHIFAGYSGGRKSILPGVAHFETVCRNHSLLFNPLARSGRLEGNPIHEDMLEAYQMVGADFLLNVLLNGKGEISQVFSGNPLTAHPAGCRAVDEAYGAPLAEPADLVIASCGGFPKDINLYQAQKSLEYAERAVRPGGVVILLAACADGVGSALFQKWMEEGGTSAEMAVRLRRDFVIGAHKAYLFAQLTENAHVIMISEMPADLAKQFRVTPATEPMAALRLAYELLGTSSPSTVIMPHASWSLPILPGSSGSHRVCNPTLSWEGRG